MNTEQSNGTAMESLMDQLASEDGVVRQKARESLVALGAPAVSSLDEVLQHSASDQTRWEAAKALGAINDARSIPALVEALADSNSDVAWLAAEALKKFKKEAWPQLMKVLTQDRPDSGNLYQGAHHVLVDQNEDGHDDLLAALLEALEHGKLSETAIVAAHKILERMKMTS